MNEFIIETVGLRRNFSGHMAVDGLNLKVPQGVSLASSAGTVPARLPRFACCSAF